MSNYYLHPKVHDWAIVIWQVQIVCLEFLKVPQPIFWKLENILVNICEHSCFALYCKSFYIFGI